MKDTSSRLLEVGKAMGWEPDERPHRSLGEEWRSWDGSGRGYNDDRYQRADRDRYQRESDHDRRYDQRADRDLRDRRGERSRSRDREQNRDEGEDQSRVDREKMNRDRGEDRDREKNRDRGEDQEKNRDREEPQDPLRVLLKRIACGPLYFDGEDFFEHPEVLPV